MGKQNYALISYLTSKILEKQDRWEVFSTYIPILKPLQIWYFANAKRQQINHQVIFEHYLHWNKKAARSQFVCEIQYIYLQLLKSGKHVGNTGVAHNYSIICTFSSQPFRLLNYQAKQGIKWFSLLKLTSWLAQYDHSSLSIFTFNSVFQISTAFHFASL